MSSETSLVGGATPSTPKIFEAMAQIMAEITCINKSRINEHFRYKFRGIDDVYNELHALFAKHQVFTTSTVVSERCYPRTNAKGNEELNRVLQMRYTFHTADGSSITTETVGEGQDIGDKAANKAMASAHKYALLQVFCIPTEEQKDSEYDSQPPSRQAPTPPAGTKQMPKQQAAPPPAPTPAPLKKTVAELVADRAWLAAKFPFSMMIYRGEDLVQWTGTWAELGAENPPVRTKSGKDWSLRQYLHVLGEQGRTQIPSDPNFSERCQAMLEILPQTPEPAKKEEVKAS